MLALTSATPSILRNVLNAGTNGVYNKIRLSNTGGCHWKPTYEALRGSDTVLIKPMLYDLQENHVAAVLQELQLLVHFRGHPNIVSIVDLVLCLDGAVVVTEIPGQALERLFASGFEFSEELVVSLMYQLLFALLSIHRETGKHEARSCRSRPEQPTSLQSLGLWFLLAGRCDAWEHQPQHPCDWAPRGPKGERVRDVPCHGAAGVLQRRPGPPLPCPRTAPGAGRAGGTRGRHVGFWGDPGAVLQLPQDPWAPAGVPPSVRWRGRVAAVPVHDCDCRHPNGRGHRRPPRGHPGARPEPP
eukprot:RCo043319